MVFRATTYLPVSGIEPMSSEFLDKCLTRQATVADDINDIILFCACNHLVRVLFNHRSDMTALHNCVQSSLQGCSDEIQGEGRVATNHIRERLCEQVESTWQLTALAKSCKAS